MGDRNYLLYSGDRFEFHVMDVLRAEFHEVKLLHDKHLYSDFLGKDTQLDLVAITSGGIFCIEAKGWSEWIKGGYNDHKWTGQSRERRVITVFNPIYQNLIHTRALCSAIRVAGGTVRTINNLVVLPDGTRILSDCKEICNLSLLPKRMRNNMIPNSIDVEKALVLFKKVCK